MKKKKNCLILIDEIETNLTINTRLQILEYLKSIIAENKNIFIEFTNHSPLFFENKQMIYTLII